jgi:chromosome segregation ATPase
MDEVVNLAQAFRRDLTLKDDQIHSLGQGIARRDTTIGHLEVQTLESDAQILQRNTVIDFLQEQVHDLNQELGKALGHIEMLQEQQMPPLVPNELEEEEEDPKEEPEEIEGVSEIDSEHGDAEPNPQNDDSSSWSASSVGNLDDP